MALACRARAQAGIEWLPAAARAVDHATVTIALSHLTLSGDFERFVGHPDDATQRNLCRMER